MRSNCLRISFWIRNFKFATLHFMHILFVIVFFFFLQKLENVQTVLNGQNEALPEKTTTYFTVNNVYRLDLSCIITADEMEHTTLLLHEPAMGLDYEVLYTYGEKNMFDGIFFDKKDFVSGTFSIVFGCNLKENQKEIDAIKEEANKTEDEVQVLGTLPPSANAAWNYSIFYTKGQLKNVDATSVFAISSMKKEYTDNAMDFLEKVIAKKGGVVQYSNFRQVSYQDFLGKNNIYKLLFYGLILIAFLSETALVSAALRWRKTFCTLLFFLGSKKIMLRELLRLLRILLTDTFLSGLLLWLLCRKSIDWNPELLFESMCLFLAIGCVVNLLIFFFNKQNKRDFN